MSRTETERKEETSSKPQPPAFTFDIDAANLNDRPSAEDSSISELNSHFQDTLSFGRPKTLHYPVTASALFSGGIMATNGSASGGSSEFSSPTRDGCYFYGFKHGDGPTNIQDNLSSSGCSSGDGSPPQLHSPTIYQPQNSTRHMQNHPNQTNGFDNPEYPYYSSAVQRSNSLPFELNGQEVPSYAGGYQHDNVYSGPVSQTNSIGTNGRLVPSVRLAMGLNDVRRKQKVKYNFCVFCKNNGEDEKVYMDHTLKHDNGTIRCPILYNYECPLCGATGPVSHTIRYCPSSKGRQQLEEVASITQLKQMRSSTGRLRTNANNDSGAGPIQISRGPPQPLIQDSNSVCVARQFCGAQQQSSTACDGHTQGQPNYYRPVLGQGHRNRDASRVGPNAAWTGSATQPCITPMYGEYVNNQTRHYDRCYEALQKALAAPYQSTQQHSLNTSHVTPQAQNNR